MPVRRSSDRILIIDETSWRFSVSDVIGSFDSAARQWQTFTMTEHPPKHTVQKALLAAITRLEYRFAEADFEARACRHP
jgi:hypothetical protein